MWTCDKCGGRNCEDENGCVGCPGRFPKLTCNMFGGEGAEGYNVLMSAIHRAAGGEDNEHIYSFFEKTPKTSFVVELYDAVKRLGYEIRKK